MSSSIDIDNVVRIPNREYASMKREVAALKPSKRKNWRAQVTDRRGVKCRIMYKDDGEFFLPATKRLVIATEKCLELRRQMPGGYEPPPLPLPALSAFVANFERACAQGNPDAAAQDTLNQLFWDDILSHHTGNHYRNHSVKIPTAVGQPCRG